MAEKDSVTNGVSHVTKEEVTGDFWIGSTGYYEPIPPGTDQERENQEVHIAENATIPENVTKPFRKKEMRISLYLNEEKVKLLYELCGCCGIDRSRIDDRQGGAIWEMLEWMAPVLKVRAYFVELFGPIFNETPDRERKRG